MRFYKRWKSGSRKIEMRILFFLISFLFVVNASGDNNKIAEAIYKIEGGKNTKFPYGIKSINTKGNKEKAKRICLNTIKNNQIRFSNLSELERKKYHCFLDFLGSRYCPVESDPRGHKNWIKNIHLLTR